MCQCSRCRCETMKINGEPRLVDWGYGWNVSDTQTIRWFIIEIPYKCTECGFEDIEEISASDE